MGSNQNVNFSSKGSGKRFILLFSGSESADHVDGYGKGSHTFEKRVAVLLCKYGSRHEKRYLTAFLNGFERTAHRYFGFRSRHRHRTTDPLVGVFPYRI